LAHAWLIRWRLTMFAIGDVAGFPQGSCKLGSLARFHVASAIDQHTPTEQIFSTSQDGLFLSLTDAMHSRRRAGQYLTKTKMST